MDDKNLLKKVNRKDEQAWRVFFRSYYDSLFHHALRILEDEKEAEDVVQELFIALWNNGIMLGENDSLSGYLYRAVTNRCLNRIRDQKRMNEHLAKWKEEAEGEASEAEFASAVREGVTAPGTLPSPLKHRHPSPFRAPAGWHRAVMPRSRGK